MMHQTAQCLDKNRQGLNLNCNICGEEMGCNSICMYIVLYITTVQYLITFSIITFIFVL